MNATFIQRHLYAGALLLACHAAAAQTYTYAQILPPGSVETTPTALSESGIVLGYWADSGDNYHGFTFQNGTYTNIDYPKAIYTQPSGFNEKGEIVGSFTDAKHHVHAFLYSNGKFKEIDAPGGSITELPGINSKGVALGYSSAGSGLAFEYKKGVFTTINDQSYVSPVAINKAGSATGNYFPPEPQPTSVWLYSGGTLLTLPNSSANTECTGLNDENEVVGFQLTGNTIEGFLYGTNGQITAITYPHATSTYAEGINDSGDIAGYYTDAKYNEYGFVLSKRKFIQLKAPKAAGTYALASNTAGQVLGGYHDANRNQYVFLATPSQ